MVSQIPSTVEPQFYPAHSDPPPIYTSSPTSLTDNATIAALQASIADLLEQREQLEITIVRVLSHHLDALLAQKNNE